MKLYEILKPNVPCLITHPDIGIVRWDNLPTGLGFILTFNDGPEKGNALRVDPAVLFEDTWEIYESKQEEISLINL